MPSGKTHDAVTFLLALPVGALSLYITGEYLTAGLILVLFLVGGLMFGPDLDTHSKQYTRWGFFRFLWYPYQRFFKHRSRWSHGYLLGTILRVTYFTGVITLLSFLVAFVAAIYIGGELPNVFEFLKVWKEIGGFIRLHFGKNALLFCFLGLWIGAASHTIIDMIGTFIKTGRIGKVL